MGSPTMSGRWTSLTPLRALALIVGALVVAAAAVLVVDRTVFSKGQRECPFVSRASSTRPELQRILDELVSGENKLAPGVSAYVSGPKGSWSGAAGVANASTCEPMTPTTRVRLESVSKIYTATLILQLAQEGKLKIGDTVARWLPGLLHYGNRITIQELLTMRSGLVDNNDMDGPEEAPYYLARVKDPRLRAQLEETLKRRQEHPEGVESPMFWIRLAASQPLEPERGYHYSNIGYDILGLIAEKAGGAPLKALYEQRIFRPLGLRATADDPQGPIRGPHARGYGIEPGGKRIDATDWHFGVGAPEGGLVSDASDTAAFLTALMKGKLLNRRSLAAMEGEDLWNGGAYSSCGRAFGWSGGGNGFKTEVWVSDGADRVAVLLLNARHWGADQAASDAAANSAMTALFCLG